ncbi:MAG: phage portal protein, partial [Rickettsiales bacterium]|nr:phage portal protein [Rickettsiales bacterium]
MKTNFFNFFSNKNSAKNSKKTGKNVRNYKSYIDNYDGVKTYLYDNQKPVWMNRSYAKFSEEGFIKNVVAHRCISMISKGVASINLKLFQNIEEKNYEVKNHNLLNLIKFPNPLVNGNLFKESIFNYRLISGNSYILAVRNSAGFVQELYCLRPDKVSILTDKSGFITAYIYKNGAKDIRYPVDKLTGQSDILHLKNFHPLDEHFGLSPIESAAYSIDQHNQASQWNQSLLQNGAKPSGALVVKSGEGYLGVLTDEQHQRIKRQIDEEFSGVHNAGRPLLLEGGLDWKEMSLSPKDMDFISSKHTSAREIALAFGVPPQLLGIPGDNTYSNLAEARLEFWEQTILPLAEEYCQAMNHWLLPMFN